MPGAVNPGWVFSQGNTATLGYGVIAANTTDASSVPTTFYFHNGKVRKSLPFGNITRNAWTHLAVVVDRDQNVVRTYRQGSLVNEISLQGTARITKPDSVLRFGGHVGGTHFHGSIDSVYAWNRAISEDEVLKKSKAADKQNN